MTVMRDYSAGFLVFALFFMAIFGLFFAAGAAQAQEIVTEPICFEVINDMPYKVQGEFVTAPYMTADGRYTRHRSNFRFEAKGGIDADGHPADQAEFCSYGPFFEGRRLEFVLRTLYPVFSCYTKIEGGPIVIKGKRKENAPMGGYDIWAECVTDDPEPAEATESTESVQ